jgi:hypothetical protein
MKDEVPHIEPIPVMKTQVPSTPFFARHRAQQALTTLAIVSGMNCFAFLLNVLAWTWLGDNAPLPIARSLWSVLIWLVVTALFAFLLYLLIDPSADKASADEEGDTQ